jgi:glycosyltransferase involved in cell wall biosynthesis
VISVVVAVKDGLPWLEDQLGALGAQVCDDEWEVLVADNGSTDGSFQVAAGWSAGVAPVRVVDASARPGPAAARNVGADQARGEYLLFCDADDVVQPGWIAAMSVALGSADVVAGSFETGSLNGGGPRPPLPAVTRQLGQVPAGLAANLGVRRASFDAVGGFDENLRVGEDVDLCWRLQFAGYKFAVQPEAVVAKRDRETGGGVFVHGVRHGRSGPALYRRHRDDGIRRDLPGVAKSWGWLLAESPFLYRRDLRRRWLRAAGVRTGRILGSVENGVFFP